jgi:teichuronic acid biosynthesis glycosyltransferase TuaC
MRVLVFSYMYPSVRHSNAGVWVEDQVRALSKRVQVNVVSPTPWAPRILWPLSPRWRAYGSQPADEQRYGIKINHPKYLQFMGAWSVALAGIAMATAARRAFSDLASTPGFDVIHVHQLVPDGFAATLLAQRFGKPVVCTLHGSDVTIDPFHNRANNAAARYVARQVNAFIAVEHALRHSLQQVTAYHAPMHVIPNGIDLDRFRQLDRSEARRRLGIEPNIPVILYVGLLIKRKGVDVLLKAFARISQSLPSAQLILVGGSLERDDQRIELERLAESLSCKGRVLFAGPRPYDELPLWYAAADVFTLASRLEGFPTVVRESIACGTPVVVTALPGMFEEIGPPCGIECGTVVPVDDPEALAAGLVKELRHPRDGALLRERAQRWHWDRNIDRLLSIYETVVSQPRGRNLPSQMNVGRENAAGRG